MSVWMAPCSTSLRIIIDMSIRDGKVRLYLSRHRNAVIVGGLICLQFILTIVLSISLAANIIWPENVKGAAPAPLQISYEGRLTDTSGNPLGGTGTAYCYQFSIYNTSTGGTQLWPASTPSPTTATTTDGVFSAVIGQADSLSSTVFDFSTTSTAYLQVAVSTSSPTCTAGVETLSPRQQILSSGYAMSANSLGSYVTANLTSGDAQIGSGSGVATPVYLGLDWKNTVDYVGEQCSTNGLMWYNSNIAVSEALICSNGKMEALGTSGTTTIAAISSNGTAITAGTVNFSNSNNVSFGISSNGVVTATASFPGGTPVTLSEYNPFTPFSPVTNSALGQKTLYFEPFNLSNEVYAYRINFFGSLSIALPAANSTYSGGETLSAALYGRDTNNTGRITSFWSGSAYVNYNISSSTNVSVTAPAGINNSTSVSMTNYAVNNATASQFVATSINGFRVFPLPVSSSLTPGQYWLAVGISSTTQNSAALSLSWMQQTFSNQLGFQPFLDASSASNAGLWSAFQGFGQYSVISAAFPASVTLSTDIKASISATAPYFNISGWTTATSVL